MNLRARAERFAKSLAISLALILAPIQASFADTPTTDCSTSFNSYVAALNTYSAATKPTGADFKELSQRFQEAQQERATCLREVNQSFKDQLQQIRDKYASLLAAANKKTASTLRTQLASEISSATLNRDEFIKNLPALPKLPERVKKK